MFVERPEDSGKMIVGYLLNKATWFYAPKGLVRIARFDNAFWPDTNKGYYADIYFKRFIRKWKKITYENKQRRYDICLANHILQHYTLPTEINNVIIDYI